MSRPTRARGLKSNQNAFAPSEDAVAPHTGAWIEMARIVACVCRKESRPTRARGLKLDLCKRAGVKYESRPTRARGLKFHLVALQTEEGIVAPHAGAWIEIMDAQTVALTQGVAPHAGAWIEIHTSASDQSMIGVAPHAGAWIEMLAARPGAGGQGVAPHAGAWIEIKWFAAKL